MEDLQGLRSIADSLGRELTKLCMREQYKVNVPADHEARGGVTGELRVPRITDCLLKARARGRFKTGRVMKIWVLIGLDGESVAAKRTCIQGSDERTAHRRTPGTQFSGIVQWIGRVIPGTHDSRRDMRAVEKLAGRATMQSTGFAPIGALRFSPSPGWLEDMLKSARRSRTVEHAANSYVQPCMPTGKCIALFTLLCSLGSIWAETVDIELRHLSASKFVEQWVRATEASAGRVPIQKAQTSFGVSLNGTKLEVDERSNKVTVIGDEKAVNSAKEMATALDLAPQVIQLKCVRLRVGLKPGGSALDVLGEGGSGNSVFPAGKVFLESLLQNAKDHERIKVISNFEAVCADNEEAIFTSSSLAGETSKIVVTPVVNSSREITILLAHTNEKQGRENALNAKVTLADGAAILVGGTVERDPMGNSVEFPLLLQVGIIGPTAR